MTAHVLKTWPRQFNDLIAGKKKFEFRKNDRDFKVNDRIRLIEWDTNRSAGHEWTGKQFDVVVTYILDNVPEFGMPDGYVVLGIEPVNTVAMPSWDQYNEMHARADKAEREYKLITKQWSAAATHHTSQMQAVFYMLEGLQKNSGLNHRDKNLVIGHIRYMIEQIVNKGDALSLPEDLPF